MSDRLSPLPSDLEPNAPSVRGLDLKSGLESDFLKSDLGPALSLFSELRLGATFDSYLGFFPGCEKSLESCFFMKLIFLLC